MLFGYSKILIPVFVYILMFFAIIFSLTKNKEYALYITLPLICLPNVRMKLAAYPFGKDFIDIVFLCLILSLLLQRRFSITIRNGLPIILYMAILAFSFFITGDRLSGGIPEKELADFKNYMMIPLAHFVVFNTVQKADRLKILILVLSLAFLAMDRISYSEYGLGLHPNFVSEQRAGGVFESEGLGSNHLGAFMAEYTMIILGICALIGWKFTYRTYNVIYIFWLAIIGNLYSLLYSFSRGAWMGGVAGIAFLGAVKSRKVLIALILVAVFWQHVLPNSVIQRLSMTEQTDMYEVQLDAATEHRMEIWGHSLDLFQQNPIIGIGLYRFQFFDGRQLWLSTHNQYLAFLSETGIIGFSIFLLLFFLAFRSGWRLYRRADDRFLKGLGLGFCAVVVAAMVSNFFGDRWTFFSLQGLYFVFWALVEKGYAMETDMSSHEPASG